MGVDTRAGMKSPTEFKFEECSDEFSLGTDSSSSHVAETRRETLKRGTLGADNTLRESILMGLQRSGTPPPSPFSPFEQSKEETLREQVLAGMKSPRPATAREGDADWQKDDAVWDGKKPVFDFCTLRTWFMEMDTEKDGRVSKQGFLQFFRDRPPLRRLLMYAGQVAFKEKMEAGSRKGSKEASAHYTRPQTSRGVTAKEAEALTMRRLLRLLKAIDEDGSGTIEWDEFVEFWRKAGFLLEYETKDNPREQIADLLGQIHDDQSDGTKADDNVVQRLSVLGKTHLSSQQFARAANNTQSFGVDPPPSMSSRMSLPPLQMSSQGAILHRKSYLTPHYRQRFTIQ